MQAKCTLIRETYVDTDKYNARHNDINNLRGASIDGAGILREGYLGIGTGGRNHEEGGV